MSAKHMFSVANDDVRRQITRNLTDEVPVMVVSPASISDIKFFAAQAGVKMELGWDVVFRLAAMAGVSDGMPVIVGAIQVAKPFKREIGDLFKLEVSALVHDRVAGVREFLLDAALKAARALGYREMIYSGDHTDAAPAASGFALVNGRWSALLEGERTKTALPEHITDL